MHIFNFNKLTCLFYLLVIAKAVNKAQTVELTNVGIKIEVLIPAAILFSQFKFLPVGRLSMELRYLLPVAPMSMQKARATLPYGVPKTGATKKSFNCCASTGLKNDY